MKRLVSFLMALALLAVFSFGCSSVSKQAKIKCPKCGAVFTVQEGLDAVDRDKAQ
jgi:Phr family secreted Rap phosphatase inhibitor